MRSTLIATLMFFAGVVAAAEPVDNARTKALFTQLRCVVCQNQSIADSDAAVAADLRAIVRSKIAEGATDAAIREYLVARYGEFVLLRPRLRWSTFILWAAPALVLAFGVGALLLARRKQHEADPTSLSPDEERRLQAMLDDHSST